MNNFEYSNIDEILLSNAPIRGSRFNVSKERRVIIPFLRTVDNLDTNLQKDSFEMHLFYPDGGYIGSNYNIKSWQTDDEENPTKIHLNPYEDLNKLIVQPGTYKIVYNFFRNYISSELNATKLFIAEISNDRRELVLALTDPNDGVQVNRLKSFVLNYLKPRNYFPPIVLNFGENKIVDVINIASDGSETYLYVKLFNPLPFDLGLKYECWLATQLMKPYIDNIKIETITQNQTTVNPNILRGPNYSADYTYNTVTETDFKSWNDLLSTNLQTSQEILNKYVNGDNKPVKINIDFSNFKNFCFYSSAEDRVDNFFYKMQVLEQYRVQIQELNSYNVYSTDVETNIINIKNLIDKLVSGFDEWEKWLYYEQYKYDPFQMPIGIVTPYPKYEISSGEDLKTKNGKFSFWKTTQGPGLNWYRLTKELAKEFDTNNSNLLYKVLPRYIIEDSQNEKFISFVNMIGQHFDIIFTYTEHILYKNLRKENPKFGLSQDLIQIATKNLGWNLSSNISDKELWEYALGINDQSDSQYNILGKSYNKTEEERTKEVWRRILNNLPYIYRTKGTSRGIRALIAAYGIPQTLLSIREFGGAYNPNSYDLGKNLYEKSTYYLNFEGSFLGKNQYIELPWEKVNHYDEWKYPDTVTFRFKMEPEKISDISIQEIQTILEKSSSNGVDWFVTANKNGTDIGKGSLTFYLASGSIFVSASIYDEYIYEDVPLNIMIRRNISNDDNSLEQKYDFILKTEKYGKIVVDKTQSISIDGEYFPQFNNAWNSEGKLLIGSGSNFEALQILSGSIFELRYWSNPLSTTSFDNHVLAARAYNGNTPSSSFYDLQGQWRFWQYFDPSVTSSLESSHPNQKNNTFYSSSKTANLVGFTTNSFENFVETYLMDTANVGAMTDYSQKIRIDSASLSGALNVNYAYEKSALEMNTPDSNRLVVAFSPQTVINEDIYEAIGDVDLSEYMGGYSSFTEDGYPELKNLANEYWKKYKNKNDFNAYISIISKFDLSVFEQIKQTLPARANEIVGLVIEPNVLERSKALSVKSVNAKTEGYVNTSNVLSPYPKNIDATDDSRHTVLFLGFEEGDLLDINIIESETNIKTDVSTQIDEGIKMGDVDVDMVTSADVKNNQKGTIITPSRNIPKMEFKTYNTLLKTYLIDDSLKMQNASYNLSLKSKTYKQVAGETLALNGYAKIDLLFTTSGSMIISGSTFNQISNYENDNYYRTIIPKYKSQYLKNIGYLTKSGSIFRNPHGFETAKEAREFFGCNDYPFPYKSSIAPNLTTNNKNIYALIYENFEDRSHSLNEITSLKYNNVFWNQTINQSSVFPSSSFWKTDIRGGFFTGNTFANNSYGMKDSAPRIVKLNTSANGIKKLFTPQYLQESLIFGSKKYLNYPTSPEYIRGFPWVLWWKGNKATIPNLGPDYGFTADSVYYSSDIQRTVSSPNNPKIQA
jgi:hypothetical protein